MKSCCKIHLNAYLDVVSLSISYDQFAGSLFLSHFGKWIEHGRQWNREIEWKWNEDSLKKLSIFELLEIIKYVRRN